MRLAQAVEILLNGRNEPVYYTHAITWLLMTWRHKKPRHQQQWLVPFLLEYSSLCASMIKFRGIENVTAFLWTSIFQQNIFENTVLQNYQRFPSYTSLSCHGGAFCIIVWREWIRRLPVDTHDKGQKLMFSFSLACVSCWTNSRVTDDLRWHNSLASLQQTNFTNPRLHLFHIPHCSIQNRNVHISVLNGALGDMEQVHYGICETGQLCSVLYSREARIVSAPHRDSIVRVAMVANVVAQQNRSAIDQYRGRYLSVSREGALCFWSTDLKLLGNHKIEPPLENSRSIWVTDVAVMTRAQMMAVATTSRDMLFYDIAANRFRCVTKVTGLQSCPTTLHFWSPLTMSRVDGPEDNLCLIWGNANGGVGALCFSANPDTTAINPKQTQPHSRRIPFAEILSGGHPKIKGYILNGIHKDLVHQVTYLHHTKCFISCSRDTESAMFMGDFELKMHKCYFKVQNGVFSFDYVPSLNIIVSGGYDAIVRIWNPYVPSKPIIVLQGHKSPITQVKVNLSRETIISIADNKEIRIFDLNTQTCIQTFYRKMFPGMGPRPFTGLFFNERRQALILGTTRLLSLEHCEEDLRTRKTISHLRPVTTVLYNPLFQQVVSAGSCSTVCVWHVFSGDKVSQSLENELRECYHFRKSYQNDDISVSVERHIVHYISWNILTVRWDSARNT